MDDDSGRLGTAGLIMRRVDGETIPRRLLRDEQYADARRHLVADLGRFLAELHTIDPGEIPSAQPYDSLSAMLESYERLEDRSPTFEKAYEWLVDNRPAPSSTSIVHGDLRLGNIIVDAHGLAAVIDWELVHIGDPVEDLAYLCLKAWRFGMRAEVGGLGSIDDLVAVYESSGGRIVDRRILHWWLVNRTLYWGVGCMAQAAHHLSGRVRSVELAAVGRRAAEQEWDLLELLAPAACEAALAAPLAPELTDVPTLYGRPTARELLDAVGGFLTDEAIASEDPRISFHARVAANVLAIVGRELGHEVVDRVGDHGTTLALNVRDRLAVASPRHLDAARAAPDLNLGGSYEGHSSRTARARSDRLQA